MPRKALVTAACTTLAMWTATQPSALGAVTSSLTRMPAEDVASEDDASALTLDSAIPEEVGIKSLASLVEFSLLTSSSRRHASRAASARALKIDGRRNSGSQADRISSKAGKFRARTGERVNGMLTSLPLSVVGPATGTTGTITLPTVHTYTTTPPAATSTTLPSTGTPGANGTGISFAPAVSAADVLTPVPEPGTLGIFGIGLVLAAFGSRAIGRRLNRDGASLP